MHRRVQAAFALAAVIPIGLAVRFAPLHLPWIIAKYAGSALWAAALYWFLAALLPKLRPPALFALATLTAAAVELSRLVPIPAVDAFRLTLAGRILLGRFFSFKNILAYAIGIAVAAALDATMFNTSAGAEPHTRRI